MPRRFYRAAATVVMLAGMLGCGAVAHRQFYVESSYTGYYVTINLPSVGTPSARIAGPYATPLEADSAAKKLNSDVNVWADKSK